MLPKLNASRCISALKSKYKRNATEKQPGRTEEATTTEVESMLQASGKQNRNSRNQPKSNSKAPRSSASIHRNSIQNKLKARPNHKRTATAKQPKRKSIGPQAESNRKESPPHLERVRRTTGGRPQSEQETTGKRPDRDTTAERNHTDSSLSATEQ